MFSGSSRYFVFRKRLCIETPVFFLLILFLCSIPATAADYNIVTADLPPWSTKGTAGIILDIVKEIEKRLGTSNIPHELPWMRAQKNTLENDNYLIFPLTRISSREEDFTWIVDVMPFETVFITVGSNSIDRLDRVIDFRLVRSQLIGVVETFVGRMNRQFTHGNQQVVDFSERAFSRLDHRDGSFRVLNGTV